MDSTLSMYKIYIPKIVMHKYFSFYNSSIKIIKQRSFVKTNMKKVHMEYCINIIHMGSTTLDSVKHKSRISINYFIFIRLYTYYSINTNHLLNCI